MFLYVAALHKERHEAAIADFRKSDAGSACDTDPQNQLEVANYIST